MSPSPLWTRPFVVVTATHLALAMGVMLFVHFPGYLQDLGAGEFAIGNVAAISSLVAMGLGPFVGSWLDRRGRRRGLLVGAALFAGVCLLYLSVEGLGPWLYFVRVLDGLGSVLIYAALFTMAADLVPAERRTEGIAIFGSAGLLAIGLSAELGVRLLDWGGYRALFCAASALTGVALILASTLSEPPREPPATDARPTGGFWGALRQSDLRPVWATAFVFFLSMSGIFTFMKTFVLDLAVGSVASFFGAYSTVAVALRLFAGWLPDRVGPARMLGPALGCYALGFLMLMNVQSSFDLLLAGGLCGVGHGYTFPILFSLVVSRCDPGGRGAATGIYTTIDYFGHLVGGPALGFLIERAGYAVTFGSAAGAIAFGIAGFYLWDTGVSQRPLAPEPPAA